MNPSPKYSKSTTDIFTKVYAIVRTIPKGRATSYGAIGEVIGSGISARIVGWAMNAAHHVHPPVPAHRVVNRNGLLTGKHHFATPTLMEELLIHEGIDVEDDKIVNFKEVFWQPAKK
jgi:methylated-DNA-protein-cysteine methyltransferase related protein